ncbi:glycosyl transferase family 28 [Streptomyces sp. ZEA17I]|uniref:activator-dependent family glycosyltransferase n=1 Tax=Streptomyces sp. ZEA17I TaxID=2202516 RepID=UPI000D6FF3C3|nr:activator-dependent family glycosyltransferase [Streptomyces sp. ZEA17I]PWS39777.1 glycosyl transferase family 28 [Streptomyces sp. ZEA17I]
MRVLFTAFATRSHMYAFVPLAWSLRAAGHDVLVASQPDLVEDIQATGLTAVGVGEPLNLAEDMIFEDLAPGPDDPHGVDMNTWPELLDIGETSWDRITDDYAQGVFAAYGPLIFHSLSSVMMDGMVDFARWWKPDLVIWDTMTYAGPVAAKASGAAHARLLFGLDLVGWMRQHHLAALAGRHPALRDDPMAEWLSWTLGDYGREFTEDTVLGQWTIDPVPTSMALPTSTTRLPVRYVPYNGPSTIPPWISEKPGRPRVCVTMGVSQQEVFGKDRASLQEIITATAELDIEVVATLNARQLATLGELPANVRAVDFVPLDALLPSCAAIIHHGGSGSFKTALAHGVPQIIVPAMLWDTVRKAELLTEAGAGLRIEDPDRFTAAELRDLLSHILDDPSYARQAARFQREIRATPAPADIVPTLEGLTAHHRTGATTSVR